VHVENFLQCSATECAATASVPGTNTATVDDQRDVGGRYTNRVYLHLLNSVELQMRQSTNGTSRVHPWKEVLTAAAFGDANTPTWPLERQLWNMDGTASVRLSQVSSFPKHF